MLSDRADFPRTDAPAPLRDRVLAAAGIILLILYFTACLTILLSRWLITTQLDRLTDDFERLASEKTGISIRAGKIDASFTLLNPVLTLTDVTLSRPDGPVSLKLPLIQAELSWSTLWHLEPRFETLIISSPSLEIRELAKGVYDIAGFAVRLAGDDKAALEVPSDEPLSARQPFTEWLFAQGKLLIENGRFRFSAAGKSTPVELEDVTAVFRQGFIDYHAAVSGTLIERGAERSFDLRARVEKSIFSDASDPLTWKGELYADLDHIQVARLIASLGLRPVLSSGTGGARLWAGFDAGKVTSLTADLSLAGVRAQISPELAELNLPQLSGRLRFSGSESGPLEFSAEQLAFSAVGVPDFGPADLGASCERNGGRISACSFRASEISLDTLAKLGSALPLPKEALTFLSERPVSGVLRQMTASFEGDYADPSAWDFDGYFTGLTLPAASGIPGFRNISGSIASRGPGEFEVRLDTYYASLFFPGIFRRPQMDFESISGRVLISAKDTLQFSFEDIAAKNADGRFTGAGSWTGTGGAGTIDISGTAENIRAVSVQKYLPIVAGDAALDYVEAAVLGGRGSKGRYIVKGKLDDFPWDGMPPESGHFLIEADVVGGVLDFMPSRRQSGKKGGFAAGDHFPPLENISGHLLFEGNRMLITGRSGSTGKLRAKNVRVEIPSFAADTVMLTVDGEAAGDLSDALGYLSRTPFLHDALGGAFDASSGSGAVTAQLDLDIPLTGSSTPHWAVNAELTGGKFRQLPILPEITKLSGKLRAADDGVITPAPFKGETAAGPITISAAPSAKNVLLTIAGTAGSEDFSRLIPSPKLTPLMDRLTGSAPFTAEAAISLEGKGLTVKGESPLTGIISPLPAPMEKPAGRSMPARFEYSSMGDATRFRLWADPLITLDLGFKGETLERGWIGAGLAMRNVPKGIEAAVKAERAELAEWLSILNAVESAGGSAAPAAGEDGKTAKAPAAAGTGNTGTSVAEAALASLTKIEADVNALTWKGEPMGRLSATIRQVPGIWHLRAQGDVISGQAEFAAKSASNPRDRLTVKLNRLTLPDFAEEGAKQPQPAAAPSGQEDGDLPDISLVIDELSWGKRHVGKVEMTAEMREGSGGLREWRMNNLTVRNAGGTLVSDASWRTTPQDRRGITTFKAKGNVTDSGKLLTSLAVHDVVRGAPGTLETVLSWAGRPIAFNAETLSGSFTASAQAGQLLQVEPGAGRLLSLLSMQHLLQRLTLDFRDVFSRGFRFDSLRTDGTIHNGVITLQKTTLAGSAATVVTQGKVNLVKNTLDLEALVLPSLNGEAASLAVAIANPAIGIGSLVAQWLFKDQISSLLSSEYTVKGSIDSPEITKLSSLRPAAQNAQPAQKK